LLARRLFGGFGLLRRLAGARILLAVALH
jgi:hypothetical protein